MKYVGGVGFGIWCGYKGLYFSLSKCKCMSYTDRMSKGTAQGSFIKNDAIKQLRLASIFFLLYDLYC